MHFAAFNDLNSVETLLKETGAKIILLEMVQGEEAGNRPAEQAFVDGLWKLAKKYDALIIDDEVQAGFGRTAVKQGDWFACMSYNVTPDIMVIGKTFGGGYPVTAVVTKKEVGGKMQYGYDGSTFGGNPMAMTAPGNAHRPTHLSPAPATAQSDLTYPSARRPCSAPPCRTGRPEP